MAEMALSAGSAGERVKAPGGRRGLWLFRAVFALLTVEFAGLGLFYLADPAGAVGGFSRANQFLGGIRVPVPDVPPWRYAAAAGMVAAGLMCAMLLADLRRNLPVLWPAAFFKGFDALLWFWYAARFGRGELPVCYAAGAFDCLQVLAMIVIARRAYAAAPQRAGAGSAS